MTWFILRKQLRFFLACDTLIIRIWRVYSLFRERERDRKRETMLYPAGRHTSCSWICYFFFIFSFKSFYVCSARVIIITRTYGNKIFIRIDRFLHTKILRKDFSRICRQINFHKPYHQIIYKLLTNYAAKPNVINNIWRNRCSNHDYLYNKNIQNYRLWLATNWQSITTDIYFLVQVFSNWVVIMG